MQSAIAKIIATTLLSLSAVAALPAFAQSETNADAARDWANMHSLNQYPIVPFKSTKTRADVKAELIAAQRAGTIATGDDYPIMPQPSSHKTRAQVRAELVQAQRDGLITNGNDYPIIKQAESHKTRAQVEAEVVTARHAAELGGNNAY